jgi:EAL domain-containing protein (putative c-di-GMP-specific phosphodiesterase class I)
LTASAARYLGFAFASADLLFEVDAEGRIGFAMGATAETLGAGETEVRGRPWRDLVADADHDAVAALLAGLSTGERSGPIAFDLRRLDHPAQSRRARLCAFRLGELGDAVSCAVTLVSRSPAPTLKGLDDFLQDVNAVLAQPHGALDLELVELPGLAARLDRPDAAALLLAVDAVLRAEAVGDAAAQIADERFALVRDAGRPRQAMIESLERLSQDHADAFTVAAESIALPSEQDPAILLKALRYALKRFMETGAGAARDSFEEVLRQTLISAKDFADMVREESFELAYQPIVDLRTGELAHFEVLARFGDGSPQKTILMAEALDLIEDFDLAVAGKAAEMLRDPANRRLRLAINISARSLVRPFFISRLFGRLGDGRGLGGRLIFELTETAHISDVPAANLLVQQIRGRGFKVCLDDFGSGSASLAYLQGFNIDTVKIDGRYVRELTADGRDGAVVRHLVKLCDELGVTTIAEMVETPEAAQALRELGVGYGQGWLFGRPAATPSHAPPAALSRGAA